MRDPCTRYMQCIPPSASSCSRTATTNHRFGVYSPTWPEKSDSPGSKKLTAKGFCFILAFSSLSAVFFRTFRKRKRKFYRYIFLLSHFLHLFRARLYHNDPKLRTPDISGGRRRQGKRKNAAIQSIVDAELVEAHSDAISTSSTVAAISRPSFPEIGWNTSSYALPNDLSLGVISITSEPEVSMLP